MNKMRLQELCHQRKWSLPKYSALNVDGPPHKPSFKGSVFVNGLTFTSDAFHSSKEAHNQAALKALLNFSSPSSSTLLSSLFWFCFVSLKRYIFLILPWR
ncbi:putative double-stranded RNA-binding domain-containing protein [Medicago truncatula]|uniref:Putative double-stranded RNA-binding domain-containing protein n=1 Tax=Medicago truncatula TaxID=3880 RepID=A0A396IT77_MEDTR|nr:putative double-stranded RNA-binding domain-containing protein [Medicago truncatula]